MAYQGMIAEIVSVPGDKHQPISAYLARPLGPGPFPGMVLLHHMPGWDEWYFEPTRKLAHPGYATPSPNLYHRAGEGSADDVAAKVRAEGGVADAQVIGDAEGAVTWLKAQPWAGRKVGAPSAPAPAGGTPSSTLATPEASTRCSTCGAGGW